MIKFWTSKEDGARRDVAQSLYAGLGARGRALRLFTALGVPDTFDGRFDALALYVSLMLARLRGSGAEADELARELSSLFVADMDRTMREVGVGDLSVGKHVKRMASAMLGRMEAYEAALAGDAAAADLVRALVRNVWRGEQPDDGISPELLADEVRAFWAFLADIPLDDLLRGHISDDSTRDKGGAENGV